ncbi:hypothetical protein [Massilia sp. ST3]|nr:hypothetical protein [Massilia sp. ST3]
MQARHILSIVLAVVCLSLSGCRQHNEPVKPIADLSVLVALH